MLKDSVTVDEALEVLNRALKADPRAIEGLRRKKIDCNEALAKDPTIQVNAYDKPGRTSVSFLGIINGLFGIDDETKYGAISIDCEVRCPKCGVDETGKAMVKDECPKCGRDFRLGNPTKFVRTNLEAVKKAQQAKKEE